MNNSDEALFDGIDEAHTCYERGESYGLERQTYARLAQCAIACARAGVEPSTIRRLANGKLGCDLTLYGKAAYTIRVEKWPAEDAFTIRLFVIGLDAKCIPLTPGILVCEAEDTFAGFFKVLQTILGYRFENTEPLTLGDVNQAYEASESDKWFF